MTEMLCGVPRIGGGLRVRARDRAAMPRPYELEAQRCRQRPRTPVSAPEGTTRARQVVCPDKGTAYRSVEHAIAEIARVEGIKLRKEYVWLAIREGHAYGKRYWDWRYPRGWDEQGMWRRLIDARIATADEADDLGAGGIDGGDEQEV